MKKVKTFAEFLNENIVAQFTQDMSYEIVVDKTNHADFRKHRPGFDSIADHEMVELVERAAKKIIQLLTIDKIDVNERVLVRDSKSHLNVVVGIHLEKSKLKFAIVTAMKKVNFYDNGENAAVIDL